MMVATDGFLSNARLRRLAFWIALAYTGVSAGWMLTAFLTSGAADSVEHLIQARIIKDSIFILLSAIVLYSVIYQVTRRIHHSRRALEAERALRQSNDRLRSVVYGSPLAIVSLDADGNVRTWNRAAEEIFGWGETE